MAVWRQGDLLKPEDACRIGLVTDPAGARVIVVSHSCDLASQAEDMVEVIVGQQVEEGAAGNQNGHSVRSLNLRANVEEGGVDFALFQMQNRRLIPKADVEMFRPWSEISYPKSQRDLLRRWMAQRYSRSEFPDAFVAWLRKTKIEERLERLAKRYSAALVGIYFDLQDDSERADPEDPYLLGITVVYKDEIEGAEEIAKLVVGQMGSAFERCKSGGTWRWIELSGCDLASDMEFPLAAANEFRRWRLEHRSLGGEPLPSKE